jgi:hypothetical protein
VTPRVGALVAILAALVAYALTDAYARGHRDGLADSAASRSAALTRVVRVTDTIYRNDTIRFARWRDRWDSVRVTDTLVRDSVVYVPRYVADSVFSSCKAVIGSCDLRVSARDSLVSSLRLELREATKKPHPVRVWADRALWLGAGIGVGALVAR